MSSRSRSRSRSQESAEREKISSGRKRAAAIHEALQRVKAAEAALKKAKKAFNADAEDKAKRELKDAEAAVENAGAAWKGGRRRRLTRRKRKGTRRH